MFGNGVERFTISFHWKPRPFDFPGLRTPSFVEVGVWQCRVVDVVDVVDVPDDVDDVVDDDTVQ